MFAPLAGTKVIDLTQVLAGPYCSYQLALLGADVIKVEPLDGGDWARQGGADAELAAAGMATGFLTHNAGKRSLAIDLKSEEGLGVVRDLAAGADVFLENFRPGTAARLGLGYDDIRALNPNIVYASLSAYGQTGPMGPRPAYDHVIQAVSGIMYLTGTPETTPNKVGAPYVDYATGLNGAFAVLAALMERARTGEGQRVDVSMLDSAMLLMASHLTNAKTTGAVPQAAGNNAFSGSASSGVFETQEGLLALAANNERQFPRLAGAIGAPELLEDTRFKDPAIRKQNAGALRDALAAAFLRDTADNWEARLAAADVPAARVRDLGEALALDQVAVRELTSRYVLPGLGREIHAPTLGFAANGERRRADAAPPQLGADSDGVLKDLGLSEDRIEKLRAKGVIPPPQT